jgi:protein-disulfide isomerase
MKLTSESKIFLGIGVVTGLLLTIAAVVFSQPPKPIEKNILIDATTHTKGNPEAKTWLVEFSDFQCPACLVFSATVEELSATYPDTLLVAYRHYPLSQHPESIPAARAAQAAGVQGKFFEMGHYLFANQASLSASFYPSAIEALSLDKEAFLRDSTDSGLLSKINADKALGDQLGINATPTFFLNGVKLAIGNPEDLKREVEKAILK